MSNLRQHLTAKNIAYAGIGIIGIAVTSSYLAFKYFEKNYPSFQRLRGDEKYIGVSYHRGTVDGEVPFKIFYPASKDEIINNKNQRPAQYFKNGDKCIDGLNIFHSRTIPKWLYPSLNTKTTSKWSKIPCYEYASIKKQNEKFPVILFSHGIRSNWDQYTNLSCQLASHGYVVIVMEHSDGSAFYTKTVDNKDLFYIRSFVIDPETGKKYNPRPWQRKHYIQFRGKQINTIRIPQYVALFKYIMDINKSDKELQNILNQCDLSNVIFGGHSFGATTAIMSAIKIQNGDTQKLKESIKGVLCLDPWLLCLSDDELTNNQWNIPTLMLTSDEYHNDTEKVAAMELILSHNNTHYKKIENLKGFTHIDYCDIAFWGPSRFSKTTSQYSKQELSDLLTNKCVEFMKQSFSNNDNASDQ